MTAETEATGAIAPAGPWSERNPGRAAGVYAAVYLAIASAAGALAMLRWPRVELVVLVTVVGTLATALSLLFVLSACRIRMPAWAEAALLLPATIVFLFARPEVSVPLAVWLGVPPRVLLSAVRLFVWPGQDLVGNIALISSAVLVGRLVSRIIKEGKLLLPVAIVASLVDIFTVFWGFVRHAVETGPTVVQALSAQAPALEVAKQVNAPILTYIGIGDFLFIAMFLSVAVRHAMPAGRAMWAAFVSMLAAAVVLVMWNPPGIPGLPFIAVAVLLVTRRHFAFTREEKRALAVAGALVVVAALIAGRLVTRSKTRGGESRSRRVEESGRREQQGSGRRGSGIGPEERPRPGRRASGGAGR